MSNRTRAPEQASTVVDLDEVRRKQRHFAYQRKLAGVMESNRRSLTGLHDSGALFTREGARAGRDLLLAHQHLLRVVSLLRQLDDTGDVPAPRSAREMMALYREVDGLLSRTEALTERTGSYLSRMQGE